MTGTAATYYDGRSSASRAVTLRVADGLLHVDGGDISTAFRLDLVRLEPRLGELPRRLDLPNGASCQVPAEFELPTPADAPARVERWVNEAEIRWVPALVATVVDGMPGDLQRAAGSWQAEAPVVVDLLRLTAATAEHVRASLDGLVVHADRMRQNVDALLARTGGTLDTSAAAAVVDRALRPPEEELA